MRWSIVCLLIVTVNYGFAQKNAVKASAFVFPIPIVYSFTVGYERMLGDKFSVQLVYNNFVYDFTGINGESGNYKSVYPEVRYYFGPQESFRNQIFIALFTEFVGFHEGDQWTYGISERYFVNAQGDMINPGILFGKNISLGPRVHMEIFVGWRYQFISKTETFNENGSRTRMLTQDQSSGGKLWLNFAYSF